MKVVLFCGGLGLRLYPDTENVPKPLVKVGNRPILLHLMKYYSHFGHNDFILCLGYKGEEIKKHFLDYNQCLSNDFVLSQGGEKLQLLNTDIKDWRITFAETGLHSRIAQRLRKVEKYLEGEEIFLANYSDVLTDLHLPRLIDFFLKQKKTGCFLSVKPHHSFHIVSVNKDNLVEDIRHLDQSNIRINGGFFIFRKDIFRYLKEGEELIDEPFQRLIKKQELVAYEYDGFWSCMDTFKDKKLLDDLYHNNEVAPWQPWHTSKGDRDKRDD